jgi:hypothetical protein
VAASGNRAARAAGMARIPLLSPEGVATPRDGCRGDVQPAPGRLVIEGRYAAWPAGQTTARAGSGTVPITATGRTPGGSTCILAAVLRAATSPGIHVW